jgi:hypothetical protein
LFDSGSAGPRKKPSASVVGVSAVPTITSPSRNRTSTSDLPGEETVGIVPGRIPDEVADEEERLQIADEHRGGGPRALGSSKTWNRGWEGPKSNVKPFTIRPLTQRATTFR